MKAKDLDGCTPAHYAAQGDHENCLKYLAEKLCSLDERDDYGHTPAHYAAQGGHWNCFKYLAENGWLNLKRTLDGLLTCYLLIMHCYLDYFAADGGRKGFVTRTKFLEPSENLSEAESDGAVNGYQVVGSPCGISDEDDIWDEDDILDQSDEVWNGFWYKDELPDEDDILVQLDHNP